MAVEIILGYDKKDDIKILFTEYTEMLIASDITVAICNNVHDDTTKIKAH